MDSFRRSQPAARIHRVIVRFNLVVETRQKNLVDNFTGNILIPNRDGCNFFQRSLSTVTGRIFFRLEHHCSNFVRKFIIHIICHFDYFGMRIYFFHRGS